MTYAEAGAYLTAMKTTDELAWLNEVSSVPLQQAIRHQQAVYTAFFAKRVRYPAVQVPDRAAVRGVHQVRDRDVISLEDLAVKNMVRNRRLARAIADCEWGTFRAMLEPRRTSWRQVLP